MHAQIALISIHCASQARMNIITASLNDSFTCASIESFVCVLSAVLHACLVSIRKRCTYIYHARACATIHNYTRSASSRVMRAWRRRLMRRCDCDCLRILEVTKRRRRARPATHKRRWGGTACGFMGVQPTEVLWRRYICTNTYIYAFVYVVLCKRSGVMYGWLGWQCICTVNSHDMHGKACKVIDGERRKSCTKDRRSKCYALCCEFRGVQFCTPVFQSAYICVCFFLHTFALEILQIFVWPRALNALQYVTYWAFPCLGRTFRPSRTLDAIVYGIICSHMYTCIHAGSLNRHIL